MNGKTSVRHLLWRLKDVNGNGRGGIAILRRLIDARSGETKHSATELEALLHRTLRAAKLPLPVAQFVIEHDGKFVARVDFAYRKLYLEADSVEFHTGTQQWQSDLKRQNRLAAIGWRPLRAIRDQLLDRPEEFVEELRTALGEASLQ